MKQLVASLICLGIMIVVTSCKGEDTPSSESLLTGTNWQLSCFVVNGDTLRNTTGHQPYHEEAFETCEMDNLTKYEASGAYTISEGTDICTFIDYNILTPRIGTWKLQPGILIRSQTYDIPINDTVIERVASTDTFQINDLSMSVLRISEIVEDSLYVYTFTRK